MIKRYLAVLLFIPLSVFSQDLKLPKQKKGTIGGAAFAQSIADSTLGLQDREKMIYNEIAEGNVPSFLRKLTRITDTVSIKGKVHQIRYYVLPDYLAIGHSEDFVYMPMTPMLAQRIAAKTYTLLPTRKLVNDIYKHAEIKLDPQPIPPTKAMITVPVFLKHNRIVQEQLKPYLSRHLAGGLTAGNKKDLIISNQIYNKPTPRVVIYGWHKPDGKPIQPAYNGHTNTWADYSHGVRLVQQTVWVDGKKQNLAALLADPEWHALFSDEGRIEKPYYPVDAPYVPAK